jgi:hypothetical protein
MKYTRYDDVPWYRKSWFNSLLAIVGFFFFPPFVWWCCINLVTGDVYYKGYDKSGNLRTWSRANKIFAFIILAVSTIVYIAIIISAI